MAPQDRSKTPNDIWTPEPELREMPPRRFEASPYPDLNAPNTAVFLGTGIALLVLGFVLFIFGIAHKPINGLFVALGIVLALGGLALVVYFPMRKRAHLALAEHLVTNGTPVIARILTSDNSTGDSQNGRIVKYQVTLPGGDMVHRETKADDRALPARIPADVTAMVDMQTGDVDLYCALPFRAMPKQIPFTPSVQRETPVPVAPAFIPQPTAPVMPVTPPATAGGLGTLGTITTPVAAAPEPPPPPPPAPVEPAPEPKKPKTGSSGLPWE